jgi:transposase
MGVLYVKLVVVSMKPLKKLDFGLWLRMQGGHRRMQLLKLKVPQPTATRWLKQVSERRTGKFRPGRPKILTLAILDRIENWFTGHYNHRILSLTDIIQEFELNCSLATLQRALDKRGFHKHTPELKEWLSPKVKDQRLEFATKYQQKGKQF